MRVGYTPPRSVHVSGFAFLCLLTPRCRLYPFPVRRASALPPASFRPPVARGTLAVQLAFPRVGYAEDFHLQESAPCRAHKEKAPRSGGNRIAARRSEHGELFATTCEGAKPVPYQ